MRTSSASEMGLHLLCVCSLLGISSSNVADPVLPVLNYPEVPREWLSVKAGCTSSTLKAKGDGVADDTAAIQACLDRINNESSAYAVYFPAGTYKVTSTLKLFRVLGGLLVGSGETTKLV